MEGEATLKPGTGTTDDAQRKKGSDLVRRLRDKVFGGSVEKLARALGRPAEEVQGWIDGGETMDADAEEKVQTLAHERGNG